MKTSSKDVVRVRVIRAAEFDGRQLEVGQEYDATPRYASLLIGMGVAEPVHFGTGRAATAVRTLIEEHWSPVLDVPCTSAPIRGNAKEVADGSS